ncbi:putative Transcription factor domain-containing protein [Seiridium unicorne]|uniref:Transcription factor domain-containing protein n=1 Tax=Seiridium unicorne TaxID=138068 RepID=A0ABR2UT90_9PEZI
MVAASIADNIKSNAVEMSLVRGVVRSSWPVHLKQESRKWPFRSKTRASSARPLHSPTPSTPQQQSSSAQARGSHSRSSSHLNNPVGSILTLGTGDIAAEHVHHVAEGHNSTAGLPSLSRELHFEDQTLPEVSISHSPRHGSAVPDSQLVVGDTYRQLGHSSSWSFSRRVREFIRDTGNGPELHDKTPIRDGAFGVPWQRPTVDLTNLDLPTPEYAEYLLSTISYSLGSMYYLFEKAEFLKKLHGFYEKKSTGALSATDPWLIQMLVILALGKSLISREASPSGPSGHVYFTRAMEALPHMYHLYEDPILSIEILGAIALFLQMMDMRLAAYGHIGDAIGICLALGLNRKHDASRISQTEFTHRSKLFWTAYVIDRKLSSLIGVPPKVHDEDIGISKPSLVAENSVSETIMAFHVELSSQLGEILKVVYGLGLQRQLGSKFVYAIQSILKGLSDVSKALQEKLRWDFTVSAEHESRAIASLHMLHNLCTIMTIRPILFFIFEQRFGHSQNSKLSDAVRHLLNICTEAALGIQAIMQELSLNKLIDLLLPFDVDALFASAAVLIIIDAIAPSGQAWDVGKTFKIMDDMALRGLKVVGPYKKDLIELDNFRQKMRPSQEGEKSPSTEPQDLGHNTNDLSAEPPPMNRALPESGINNQDALDLALESFNCSFPGYLSTSEVDPFAWMWDDGLVDVGSAHYLSRDH